jgi:predicted transcriptional regulator
VHADVKRLLALGLIERDAAKRVIVPWAEIRIRLPLAQAA